MKNQDSRKHFVVISLKESRKYLLIIFIITLTAVFLSLSGCDKNFLKRPPSTEMTKPETTAEIKNETKNTDEMRGVWVSYYELSMNSVGGGDKEKFTAKAAEITENISKSGMNTVFVHVRAFSDAFYESKIFPWSAYLTGTQGKSPGYDPLKIFIEEAHKRNLSCHAWINPYRVSYDTDFSKLSSNNPAKQFYDDDNSENDSWIFTFENGIYYNPTVPEVQKLILDGVREIVKNYDVDGIHLDDYFYPTSGEYIDKEQYNTYKSSGGKQPLAVWRREQVNTFISGLYSSVKSIKPNVRVGISPAADINKNETALYADVRRWGSATGYVDYLLPQVYFGFENEKFPFEKSIKDWSELVTSPDVKLYYGLAMYKAGEEDKFAGSGLKEWKNNNNVIARQVETVRKIKNCGGFSFYSYSSLFDDNASETMKKEREALKNVIK